MNYIEKWERERARAAFLALDDGAVFRGVAFGAAKDAVGEVVFNTGMSGYQEILTDPSYAGQFVVLTTAEVGNYGVNSADPESHGLFLSGLVIGDLTEPSNWRSETSLDEYLAKHGIPGIYGVDTRALTLHIREHGNRKAMLCPNAQCTTHDAQCSVHDADWAVAKAKAWEGLDGQDYAAKVTCAAPYDFPHAESAEFLHHAETSSFAAERHPSFAPQAHPSFAPQTHPSFDERRGPAAPLVAVYDFGVKMNILRSLAEWAHVRVVPAKTPAEEVLALKPDGVFLSNGPADPAAVTYAIENIKKLLGEVPLMGICLGHQLLSLACGARTGRLKFGHHGCNHPVRNLATGKVEITSQNHNFAVLPDSVPNCLEVTHVNLNDGSIEGVRHKTLPAFSVQYHPESCPGPHDSRSLFGDFRKMVESHRKPWEAVDGNREREAPWKSRSSTSSSLAAS